jgi:hypothetical protein
MLPGKDVERESELKGGGVGSRSVQVQRVCKCFLTEGSNGRETRSTLASFYSP